MIKPEFHTTYQHRIGDTVISLISESPHDATDDILDALARLIKRDVAGIETERK